LEERVQEVSRRHSTFFKGERKAGINEWNKEEQLTFSSDSQRQQARRQGLGYGGGGKSGTRARPYEVSRNSSAKGDNGALANSTNLMERICHRDNLNRAYQRVKANRGAPGIDDMRIEELSSWIRQNKETFVQSLLSGTYRPQGVRGVEIPKPQGGMRQLGIPTVVDRLVQQAILQVLTPIFDPEFSNRSFGFRPKRGAHQALLQAQNDVKQGHRIAVDVDLEQFFDRVNHDVLMSRMARRIQDKRLLRILRRFLEAGIFQQGVSGQRDQGTPQGGPLSPLLANILLDDLDKELERRGHRFVRYADDFQIYVKTHRAGYRVMNSTRKFLEAKLKLRVNREKSAVDDVAKRSFLGYRISGQNGELWIAPKSLHLVKQRIRQMTRRNRGQATEVMITKLNEFLQGWLTYYRHAHCRTHLQELDSWIRRRVRCYRLKQRKRKRSIHSWLVTLGVPKKRAWWAAGSSRGWWRLAATAPLHEALDKEWFRELGLVNLVQYHRTLNNTH